MDSLSTVFIRNDKMSDSCAQCVCVCACVYACRGFGSLCNTLID